MHSNTLKWDLPPSGTMFASRKPVDEQGAVLCVRPLQPALVDQHSQIGVQHGYGLVPVGGDGPFDHE